MKILINYFTLFVLINILPVSIDGQVVINSEPWNLDDLIVANTDNVIHIAVQQKTTLSLNQLSAYLIKDNQFFPLTILKGETSGFFIIHPKTIGIVEIYIDLGDKIVTKKLTVANNFPVMLALSRQTNTKSWNTMGGGQFRAQGGLQIWSKYPMDDEKKAACKVLGFSVIRMPKREAVDKIYNVGNAFTAKTKEIINKAKPGDIYYFYDISYKCVNHEKMAGFMQFSIK